MGDPHAAGRDWIIWWYWGVQILPPVTAPAIPRRGRVEVIQWGLSCKCTRRSPNTDAEQPSWPLLFCFMWFFSLVFWFLFLIFNLVDTYDSYEIIGTAGVVVSCKIPILTTRVRFPGSAHIFRPVKYTGPWFGWYKTLVGALLLTYECLRIHSVHRCWLIWLHDHKP